MHRNDIRLGVAALACVASLLVGAGLAYATPEEGGFNDHFTVGLAWIHYDNQRVYHATTECRERSYRSCILNAPGLNEDAPRTVLPMDIVEVNKLTSNSMQLTFNYHPFGRRQADDRFFTSEGIFISAITSYGWLAENKKIIDGVGLGYTLATLEPVGGWAEFNIGVGMAWLNDVHLLKANVRNGELLPIGAVSPTQRTALAVPMVNFYISF